jgi:hypothetical protein
MIKTHFERFVNGALRGKLRSKVVTALPFVGLMLLPSMAVVAVPFYRKPGCDLQTESS